MKRSELFFAFVQVPLDIAMIIIAFVLAYYLRIDLEVVPAFSDIGIVNYLQYSLFIMPVWLLLFAFSGLYAIKGRQNIASDLYRVINGSSTAMLVLVMGIFLSRSFFFSRLILVFTWVISILTVTLGRMALNKIRSYLYRYDIGVHRCILIGDNTTTENVVRELSRRKNLGYRVVGILTDQGSASKYGLKVVGKVADFKDCAKSYEIDEVILTDISLKRQQILELIAICSDNNITFKYVPDVFALVTTNISSGLIGSWPVVELQPIPLDGWGRIGKRILDILFSLIALILTSPLLLFAAVGTKLTSAGPIIFKQKRVGRDGKTFNFYKFRSMYTDKCDFTEKGTKWTTKADEKNRITSFGLFLRKTNIDELPQFYNVLIGNMSFVGPRPELPKFVEEFQKEIPEYFRRHRVKSGITGWAQVNGLKGDTSIKERVKYDIYYIENWSIWFDFSILLKTVRLVIGEITGGKTEYKAQ